MVVALIVTDEIAAEKVNPRVKQLEQKKVDVVIKSKSEAQIDKIAEIKTNNLTRKEKICRQQQ